MKFSNLLLSRRLWSPQRILTETATIKDELTQLKSRLRFQLDTIDKKSDIYHTKTQQNDTCDQMFAQLEFINEVIDDPTNHEFIQTEAEKIQNTLKDIEFPSLMYSEADSQSAFIHLTVGVGGDDSCDWTSMLKKMYENWAAKKKFSVEEVDLSEGKVGIKSATLQIEGENAYGWLKTETGVHRLVRISPFNAQGKRQTSFASVTVQPVVDDLLSVQINPSDLRIETMKASGPGGQHVNTTDSAVRITHIPTGIQASASTKSQHRNKTLALQVLKSRIFEKENRQREEQTKALKSVIDQQNWGAQIRNYVLHPYQSVVDVRTKVTSHQPQDVFEGHLDDFLLMALKNSFVCCHNKD